MKWLKNCCFSHDVTAAILVFQNSETAAMLMIQTGILLELNSSFFYVNAFFCSNEFANLVARCLSLACVP